MGDLNILSRPVCWSVIERTNKYAGSRYILKPDELSIPGQLARSKSAERCGSPAATSKGHWPFEAPTEPTGETSSLKGVKGERLAQ